MQFGSVGDLSLAYASQRRNTEIKDDMARLTQEIASGLKADVRGAIEGNAAYINDLELSLIKLDSYDLATTEATQFASGVQNALGRINQLGTDFVGSLLTATNAGFNNGSGVTAEAQEVLTNVISAMNANSAGRALFAGTATGVAPVIGRDDLMSALGAAVVGAGSVDDIIAAAQAWFDSPTGFDVVGYQGSFTNIAPIAISDTEVADFDIRADTPALKDTLRSLTLIALSEDPALGLTAAQRQELQMKLTPDVLAANDATIKLQARTGFDEAQIDAVTARNGAKRGALQMSRSELLSADPFTSATELEQVQSQLQALYAITSRMSRLSLVNFL